MFKLFLFYIIIINVNGLPIKRGKCKIDTKGVKKAKGIYNMMSNKRKNSITIEGDVEYYNLLMDIRFVVFHDGEEGKVDESYIDKQVSVLNLAFMGKVGDSNMIDSKITFRKESVKYVNNRGYYKRCDIIDNKLMQRYGRKNDKIINVFVCISNYYLGWAYYPWTFSNEDNRMNSIFIHTETLPDGDYDLYNEGLTLVHEIGHYFGLIHTFAEEGTCIDGDEITDTPAEKTPNYLCDSSRDSCPNNEGKDPINNFMDYSPDYCMNEFTIKQINRMWNILEEYKPTLKEFSRNNYLKDYIDNTGYYKLRNGLCMDNNEKLETYGFLKKGKYVSQKECQDKTKKYLGQAFTFTYKKDVINNKIKYNCLIHFVKTMKDIEDIEGVDTINKGKYKNSECWKLKLII